MKIFTLAPQENWICDRICSEWTLFNKSISTPNPYDADILWLLAGWCWRQLPENLLIEKKVVVTIHHVVPNKFDKNKLNDFILRDQYVDMYHVPSERTASLIRQLTQKPITIISYWYDGEFWSPIKKDEARKKLGISLTDYVVGSFQRDTEGSDLITPKLEKGPDILCDYLEKMSHDNLHILLGGWRRQYVISRLERANIKFTYIELAPIETLKLMYGSCDLYVVGSRFEGGPQSILEASSMKVPIISRDVGIVRNILSPNCIFDIPSKVYYPTSEDVEFNHKQVLKYDIKLHGKEYAQMFVGLL